MNKREWKGYFITFIAFAFVYWMFGIFYWKVHLASAIIVLGIYKLYVLIIKK